MQPNILIVPPHLYDIAERLLNTKKLNIFCGNYQKFQYRDEKPYWQKEKNVFEESKKFDIYSVVRRNYGKEPDEYAMTKSFHLPKGMRKQGYYVENIWEAGYMQDDYEPKICRGA